MCCVIFGSSSAYSVLHASIPLLLVMLRRIGVAFGIKDTKMAYNAMDSDLSLSPRLAWSIGLVRSLAASKTSGKALCCDPIHDMNWNLKVSQFS